MSQHHAVLSSLYRITVPSWETARWAHDKRLTYARAAALGIDHPLCYHPRGRDDLARLDCHFPVILKPATRERSNAFTRAKAWRCDDLATLRSRYAQASDLVGEDAIVVQELIPGNGAAQFSYAGVWDRGFPIASLVARRTRQYPADFSYSSTFVETVEQNEVEDLACRFLRSLNHSGLAEVEFKFDARDGRYKLLDVNARIWTWNALGSIAGVDFAHVLWRLALGEPVVPIRGDVNAAWIHDWLDVWAACREMLMGNLSPLSYLRCWGANVTFAGFASDDLVPGVLDLPIGLARVFARHLRKPGRLPIRQPDAKAACAGARSL
jgi:predicted ATP-grasp superfamily ATP-dependent carboligase